MFKRLLAAVLAFLAMSVFAAVDVNKGSAADLDSVKGIGPAISARIVEERAKAPFKDWQDFIDRVKGVGETNAVKLSAAGLTVGGASFKGVAPAPKKDDKAVTKPAATSAAPVAPAAATAATPAAKPAAPTKAELKALKDKEKADAKAAKEEAKAKAKADKEAAAQAKKAKAAADAASGAKKK